MISFLTPAFAYADWFDFLKDSFGFISGVSNISVIGGGAVGAGIGSRVPVFDQATEDIKKKEVGKTIDFGIPGLGSASLPIPGASGSLDSIFYNIAKMALKKITRDIVQWIRSGGRYGGPLFVTNWEDFLKNVANEASGIFIEEFELTEICQPFRPRLELLIHGGRGSPYYQRARCTIDDLARNVEDFYRDFKNGGWTRWFEITMIPQNNFYGSYYLALEEKILRESVALNAKQSEAIAGGGFLGQEVCVTASSQTGTCLKWNITSPGALIQDQLEEVFGSDIRQLELADEIDEVIEAAFQALFSSLRTRSSGIFEADIPAEDPISQSSKESSQNDVPSLRLRVSDTLGIQQAIELANQALDLKRKSHTNIATTVGILQSLDSCLQSSTGITETSATNRIASGEGDLAQLSQDILHINNVASQINTGAQELASASNINTIQALIPNLQVAVDIVKNIYDSALTENQQTETLLVSTTQELQTCEGQGKGLGQ